MRWLIYFVGKRSVKLRRWYYRKYNRWLWGVFPFMYDSLFTDNIIKEIVDVSVAEHAIGMATLEMWCNDAFGKPADEVFNMVSSKDIKYE